MIFWRNTKGFESIAAILLVLLSVVLSSSFVYLATTRPLTHLEGTLLQVFALFAGLTGSYIFGRQTAGKMAGELVRPHARSALRRLLSLYSGLGRAATAIQRCESPDDCRETLATLRAIVIEEVVTADDALEDWADIVPEDLEELRGRIFAGNREGERWPR